MRLFCVLLSFLCFYWCLFGSCIVYFVVLWFAACCAFVAHFLFALSWALLCCCWFYYVLLFCLLFGCFIYTCFVLFTFKLLFCVWLVWLCLAWVLRCVLCLTCCCVLSCGGLFVFVACVCCVVLFALLFDSVFVCFAGWLLIVLWFVCYLWFVCGFVCFFVWLLVNYLFDVVVLILKFPFVLVFGLILLLRGLFGFSLWVVSFALLPYCICVYFGFWFGVWVLSFWDCLLFVCLLRFLIVL